jgi:hypothetical protein
MKVFISWSGELSKKVAEAFREWLPNVIQQLEPFLSSGDIGAGTDWNNVLRQELDQTSYGIICLTKENWQKPWINFEAGSLSKSIVKSRCMTFLIDIMQKDITGPLAQFNHTKFEKNEVKKMLVGLNEACEPCLTEVKLTTAFDKWWPELEVKLNAILSEANSLETPGEEAKGRSTDEILEELVELVRAQSIDINRIRARIPPQLDKAFLNTDVITALKSRIGSMHGCLIKLESINDGLTWAYNEELAQNVTRLQIHLVEMSDILNLELDKREESIAAKVLKKWTSQ